MSICASPYHFSQKTSPFFFFTTRKRLGTGMDWKGTGADSRDGERRNAIPLSIPLKLAHHLYRKSLVPVENTRNVSCGLCYSCLRGKKKISEKGRRVEENSLPQTIPITAQRSGQEHSKAAWQRNSCGPLTNKFYHWLF